MSLDKLRDAPEFFLYKMLRNPLNDSAAMNIDGSSTAVQFQYVVPSGKTVGLARFMFDLIDGAIGYNEFAGLGANLTNGVKIEILDTDESILLDFTDGHNVKTNSHWAHVASIDSIIYPAAGDDALPIRFSVWKANGGRAMVLKEGQIVCVTVQDNLAAITHFECQIQGKIY